MGQIGRKDFPRSMTNVGKIHFDRESDTKSGGHFCIFEKKKVKEVKLISLSRPFTQIVSSLENLITF